jgi:hypothetical protein
MDKIYYSNLNNSIIKFLIALYLFISTVVNIYLNDAVNSIIMLLIFAYFLFHSIRETRSPIVLLTDQFIVKSSRIFFSLQFISINDINKIENIEDRIIVLKTHDNKKYKINLNIIREAQREDLLKSITSINIKKAI